MMGMGGVRDERRTRRILHPLAWWLWAICLAVAASRTTDPLLLAVLLAAVGVVVASRRTDAPWARGFPYYLALALAVVAIRVLLRAVFGGDIGPSDQILFRLPQLPLPHWLSGVQVGGPVSLTAVLAAATDGLRLGALLCCIGAANALANPKRALRVLPAALYELGVAVVVAISVAPQLIESVQRVRRARRLRPTPHRRWGRAVRGVAIPVLDDALTRSLRLAAAMDSRGYGRQADRSPAERRLTGTLLVAALLALCVGAYGLLDPSTPSLLSVIGCAVGIALAVAGFLIGGRRVARTAYRPDPWRRPEFLVVACGLVPAVVLVAGWGAGGDALHPSFVPLQWPALPIIPTLALLVAALPAFLAPPLPLPPVPAQATAPADEARIEVAV